MNYMLRPVTSVAMKMLNDQQIDFTDKVVFVSDEGIPRGETEHKPLDTISNTYIVKMRDVLQTGKFPTVYTDANNGEQYIPSPDEKGRHIVVECNGNQYYGHRTLATPFEVCFFLFTNKRRTLAPVLTLAPLIAAKKQIYKIDETRVTIEDWLSDVYDKNPEDAVAVIRNLFTNPAALKDQVALDWYEGCPLDLPALGDGLLYK